MSTVSHAPGETTARVPAGPGVVRVVFGWIGTHRVALSAFVISRLVVFAGGLIGMLVLHTHLGTDAAGHPRRGVGALLSATVDRWDAGWYLRIAEHGYVAGHGQILQRLGFLPAYPLAIRLLSLPLRDPVVAGAVISLASFAASLILLHRLCELELGRRAADLTVLVLAFSPMSLFFSALYTESPFLLLTVGSLYAMRTGRWRLACGLGAVGALTRVTGVALALALAVGRRRRVGRLEPGLIWSALVPGAVAAYMLLLAARHLPPLGILTAQTTDWHHQFVGPVVGSVSGIGTGITAAWQLLHGGSVYRFAHQDFISNAADNVVQAVVLIGLLWTAVAGRRRLAPEYLVLLLATLVICTSSPIRGYPLWSLDRYALTIVPAWMVVGDRLSRSPRLAWVVVGASTLGLLYCSAEFAIGSWVA